MNIPPSLDRFFSLSAHQTTVRTEVLAGVTTFMTMAYILVVNPQILSTTGMEFGALVTATAISAAIGTLTMALLAKYPFALAPGMGLNVFFAYTVVGAMGYSWQFALTAVFLEGLIFLALSLFNVREAIFDSIPLNLKHAVSAGIGLFIAFIGLANAGIIVTGKFHVGDGELDGLIVSLGDLAQPEPIVALVGILVTGVLLARKIKGALLIGILTTSLIGIPIGVTQLPENWRLISLPPSAAPLFFQFDFSAVFTLDMLIVLFTFLFVDVFDTVGTLAGVASKTGMLDEDGRLPGIKPALFADALGTTVGAIFGTSTVTTYVESTAGIAEGGKTGLTALTVACLFALSLFFAPIFTLIPAAATAPALVLVGLFMVTAVKQIDFSDYTEAIPAFLTIIMMPLTYSISEGIIFGMLSFVGLKLFSGKHREISPLAYLMAIAFLLKLFL